MNKKRNKSRAKRQLLDPKPGHEATPESKQLYDAIIARLSKPPVSSCLEILKRSGLSLSIDEEAKWKKFDREHRRWIFFMVTKYVTEVFAYT